MSTQFNFDSTMLFAPASMEQLAFSFNYIATTIDTSLLNKPTNAEDRTTLHLDEEGYDQDQESEEIIPPFDRMNSDDSVEGFSPMTVSSLLDAPEFVPAIESPIKIKEDKENALRVNAPVFCPKIGKGFKSRFITLATIHESND
eukprot:237276_1